jgi:phospholipid/cholesterol/gamma-HCH transport system ATP-binding protein
MGCEGQFGGLDRIEIRVSFFNQARVLSRSRRMTPTASTPNASAPALAFDRVTLMRGARTIVRDVTFAIAPGELCAVIGPSGAGKSTLLAAATGELVQSAGTIDVLGERLPLPRAKLFALRRKVGVLLQGNGLLTDLDVGENVALPLRMHTNLKGAELADTVLQKLRAVGLEGALRMAPQQLSGGMARRVALARALALDPPLMLYDEPLTGLDPITKGVIVELIRSLNRKLGLTTMVISHDIADCLAIADRVLVVANGGIAFNGTPDALRQTADPLLRQFLDGSPDGPIAFNFAPGAAHA